MKLECKAGLEACECSAEALAGESVIAVQWSSCIIAASRLFANRCFLALSPTEAAIVGHSRLAPSTSSYHNTVLKLCVLRGAMTG